MIRSTARTLDESDPITYQRVPLIDSSTPVLTMGSCFAVEIRQALRSLGSRVLPEYSALAPVYAGIQTYITGQGYTPLTDQIVDRYVMQWYFTATMRQEIERAFGVKRQDPDDLWFARGMWQDPYRRALFSEDRGRLLEFIAAVDRMMAAAIDEADVYIFTLGLTEAWRKLDNGAFAAESPGRRTDDRGHRQTEFHILSHAQCLADMSTVCDLIFDRFANRQIIVTVSPVPLGRTFSTHDHVIANTDSKSTLRSVAGELRRRYPHVHYFHSYELCATAPPASVYLADGRHVRPDVVQTIVRTFLNQFGTGNAALAASSGEPAHSSTR